MKSVLSRRLCKPSLFLGVALGSFLLCSPQANAGPAELKAIAAALIGRPLLKTDNPVTIIRNASTGALSDVVMVLLKGKTGAQGALLAGEALKQSDDSDFGSYFGAALQAHRSDADYAKIFNSNTDAVKNAAAVAKFIGGSAKSAATGTAPNAEWVDEFASQLINNDPDAYPAAKDAIASKTAAGAIIGSRVLNGANNTDDDRINLLKNALLPKTVPGGQALTAAAQEITRYVTAAITPDQIPARITALIGLSTQIGTKTVQPLLTQITTIAPGAVAGQPLEANELLDKLFTNGVGLALDVKGKLTGDAVALSTVKNAAKLAASVGLAADTEEHSFIATSFGERVAAGFIKSTQVATITKALVQSLTKKPVSNGPQVVGAGSNTVSNRADDTGEIAAYMLNAITGNSTASTTDGLAIFKITGDAKKDAANEKAATAMVLGIIKAAVKGYNLAKSPFQSAYVAADVAGSVAQTLLSLNQAHVLDDAMYAAIKAGLVPMDTKKADAVAKSINPTAYLDVKNALAEAFANVNQTLTKYEDGTHPEYQVGPYNETTGRNRGQITEPETDIRGA